MITRKHKYMLLDDENHDWIKDKAEFHDVNERISVSRKGTIK